MGHYSNECRNLKKKTNKKPTDDKTNLADEDLKQVLLLMAIEEESLEILMQGISQSELQEGLWYLDTGVSSYMTSQRELFCELDESYKGKVRFGDNSRISIEGKGKIMLNSLNRSSISLTNVLFTPNLYANILSLGRLDEQGCKIHLESGLLTIHNSKDRLITRVQRN